MKEGWKYKKLGEVCDKVSNLKWQNVPSNSVYSYVDLAAVDRDSFNITNTQSINRENAPSRAKQIIKQNDVLFGTTRPTLRRVCVVEDKNDDDICSTGFCVLRPKSEIVSSKWVFYQLMAEKYYAYIEPLQSGATYPAVTDAVVKSYIIPIPPLSEQQHIVEELDLLSSIIEKKKAQLNELDNLAQSLFYEMFGDPITNEKGWEVKKLKDVSTLLNGRAYKQDELLSEGKYKVLRVGNFFTNSSYYYSDLELEDNKYCDNGDLLFAWSASFGAFIWQGGKVIYHYHIWKVLFDETTLNKLFYQYLLNIMTTSFMNDVHGIGMVHLTKVGMEQYMLPIPPIDLQQQFASKIESIEHQKELIKQSIKEVETLFNSRMDYYFN